MSYATCDLSTRVKNATVADVRKANKQLKNMQNKTVKLLIQNTGKFDMSKLLVFSDASHGNLPKGASQGGFLVFLQGQNELMTLISWKSHKLKRVAKSAMAAETMAFLEAAEYATLLKCLVCEMYNIQQIPIVCVTDNKSLYQSSSSSSVIEDKRVYIDICAIREMIEKGDIEIRLTPSKDNLADCLTKETASSEKLLRVLAGDEVIHFQ